MSGGIAFGNNGTAFGTTNVAVVTIDASGANDAVGLPIGNTSQRPIGNSGYIRYNSDINNFEGFTNRWSSLGGSSDYQVDVYANGNLIFSNVGLNFNSSPTLNLNINVANSNTLVNISYDANTTAIAGPAYNQANSASSLAANANTLAQSAYIQANSASSLAANANTLAQSAYIQANSSNTLAQSAVVLAANAWNYANAVNANSATYANGNLIVSTANINFNNTSTVNVAVTSNGNTQANISTSLNVSANYDWLGTHTFLGQISGFTANAAKITLGQYFNGNDVATLVSVANVSAANESNWLFNWSNNGSWYIATRDDLNQNQSIAINAQRSGYLITSIQYGDDIAYPQHTFYGKNLSFIAPANSLQGTDLLSLNGPPAGNISLGVITDNVQAVWRAVSKKTTGDFYSSANNVVVRSTDANSNLILQCSASGDQIELLATGGTEITSTPVILSGTLLLNKGPVYFPSMNCIDIILNSAGTYYGYIGNPAAQVWGLGWANSPTSSNTNIVGTSLQWNSFGEVTVANTLTINGGSQPCTLTVQVPDSNAILNGVGGVWDYSWAVVGPIANAHSPGLGFSFDQTSGAGVIGALAPGIAWKTLATISGNVQFHCYQSGTQQFVLNSYNGTGDVDVDFIINRSGSLVDSVATGPSLQLQDTSNNQYGSIIQQAVGNTEFWVPVGGVWTRAGYFNNSGDLVATVVAPSDEKIKTDIVTISDALQKVQLLRGVNFTSIINNRRRLGVIAQEVQPIVPEATVQQANNMLGVDYSGMVGLLIEAIKDLKKETDNLKLEIQSLKHKSNS